VMLNLEAKHFHNGLVQHLANTLAPHRQGRCSVWVDYKRPEGRATLTFGPGWRIKPAEGLLRDLRSLLGEDRVNVLY